MIPKPIRPAVPRVSLLPIPSRAILSLAIAVALLTLPACGGGAGAGTPTAKSVFKEVTKALDEAYAELGKPDPTFENLLKVQKKAYEKMQERIMAWPAGTTYALSGLQGKVRVTVKCNGEEKTGDWEP